MSLLSDAIVSPCIEDIFESIIPKVGYMGISNLCKIKIVLGKNLAEASNVKDSYDLSNKQEGSF